MNKQSSSYQLINADCIEALNQIKCNTVDMIFADPPYFLSNGGITCKNGKMACVDKGDWDKSGGFNNDLEFNMKWIQACDSILKDDGTIWICGTYHNIHMIGYILNLLGYYILNEIAWIKPNAPPNMGCRCFTASHEILLWAKKSKKAKHTFNYQFMKAFNGNKQMRSFWEIPTTPKREKKFGNHPTQKPEALLYRCILASTNEGDLILDPFCGSGTTGLVALQNDRRFIGIEVNESYINLADNRIKDYLQKENEQNNE